MIVGWAGLAVTTISTHMEHSGMNPKLFSTPGFQYQSIQPKLPQGDHLGKPPPSPPNDVFLGSSTTVVAALLYGLRFGFAVGSFASTFMRHAVSFTCINLAR